MNTQDIRWVYIPENYYQIFWYHCMVINQLKSEYHDTVNSSDIHYNNFLQIGYRTINDAENVYCSCSPDIPQKIHSEPIKDESTSNKAATLADKNSEELQDIFNINSYHTYNKTYIVSDTCRDSSIYHTNYINSFTLGFAKPKYCDKIVSLDSIKISLSISNINNIATNVNIDFIANGSYDCHDTIKKLIVSFQPTLFFDESRINNFDIVIKPDSVVFTAEEFSRLLSKINNNQCYVRYSTNTEGALLKIHNDNGFKNITTSSNTNIEADPTDEYIAYNVQENTVIHKPLIYYYGVFEMKYSDKDYTVKQRYGRTFIDVFEKIDDSYNSSNVGLSGDTLNPYFFREKFTRTFYDHFMKPVCIERGVPTANSSILRDSTLYWMLRNGFGNEYNSSDPYNYSKTTLYDGYGNTKTQTDEIGHIVNFDYLIKTQDYFGINVLDQDYYGYCKLKTEKQFFNSAGELPIINAEYYDVFGRLRRKVQDTIFLKLTTKYNYNDIGELNEVINPKNDTIRYWYDEFGKVHYKYHPDLGYTSYRYDKLGNTRFSQNQTQADSNRVSFFEYDDLNRLTVVGEAKIGGLAHLVAEPYYDFNLKKFVFNRICDYLDPYKTNNGYNDLVTLNRTLWQTPEILFPNFFYHYSSNEFVSFTPIYTDSTNSQLGMNYFTPDGLKFFHPVLKQGVNQINSITAPSDSFENIAKYPFFIRQVYHYDEIPERNGAVWYNLITQSDIDKLTPKGKVRNLKGRLSAIAYRDKGDETFNYMVYSYDERGRVEAQVRYTENIGFDAIHYFYNSQNTITKKVVIDPYKTLATWYGYDKYGRIDSVWNELYPMNYFSIPNQINSVFTGERPPSSFYDVLYHYDKMDRIDTISYRTGFDTKKQINHYSPRSELTGMSVPNQYSNTYSYSGSGLLQQKTTIYPVYDSLLNAFTSTVNYIHNSYDFTNRLIGYNATLNGKHSFGNYYYDAAGNRDSSRSIATLNPLHPDYKCNRIHQNTYSDTYRNRLIEEVQYNNTNVPVKYQFFDYLGNGNLHQRRIKEIHSDSLAGTFIGCDHQVEKFGYNYNNLTINYQKQFKLNVLPKDSIFLNSYNFEEWRYRYNPFGERESKMRWSKCVDSNFSMSPVNAWVYYSLGISNEQNVVYQGFESSESMIYGRNTLVEMYQNYSQAPVLFMYPVEYNVFANGRNPVMTYKYDPLAAGWRKYYNIYDELGSVALVINDSGEVVESNQYKAFGVKDYAYKERPQATGYIGKEKDSESNLADHGVRKYDSDLGRFLCPDAMWEKYISFTPYQYSLNNPISSVDYNGLWAKEISKESDAHKGTIERNKVGYLASNINYNFYDNWTKNAPAVADFVANNNLFVMQKNLEKNIMGEGELGGNKSWYDLTKENAFRDLEGTALHEIVHNMGGDEATAYGAMVSAGYLTKEQMVKKIKTDPFIYLHGSDDLINDFLDNKKDAEEITEIITQMGANKIGAKK